MVPETIAKLEQAFGYGASDSEACFYAGISKDALYDYCRVHPEFSHRKEALKERPILKARQTIIDSLNNPEYAKWYLERKRANEFSTKVLNENINLNTDVEQSRMIEVLNRLVRAKENATS